MIELLQCDTCRLFHPAHLVDAKPQKFDRWWWHWLGDRPADILLKRAALRGDEFELMQCRRCFGPGWTPLYE